MEETELPGSAPQGGVGGGKGGKYPFSFTWSYLFPSAERGGGGTAAEVHTSKVGWVGVEQLPF